MRRWPPFVWLSLLPFGLGAWAPVLPARRCGRPAWAAWAALWSAVTIAGWALAGAQDGGGAAGGLIILGWVGAFATALSIRPAYAELVGSSWDAAKRDAGRRIAEREEAVRLVAEQPGLARELGVGRPDVPGAQHAGLVDVNHADAGALAGLAGVDRELAARIVRLREEVNGFASAAELGDLLSLDGHAVERLRDRAVFLPRS